MQSIKPINKAVAGGAVGAGSVMTVILVIINVVSRNYGIEVDQAEAVILAGAVSVLFGIVQGWIVWRVPNIEKAVEKAAK